MPEFFGYTNTIFGTQSTVNGAAHNYNAGPASGGTWRYTGTDTYFVVDEIYTGAVNFNGDETDETVREGERIGGTGQQTTEIGGVDRAIIYDYSFTVTDGTTTWEVAVIDVDLNNDTDLNDAGEDGYFLVFPDGMPPPDTDLTIGATQDPDFKSHADLNAIVVCFAKGTSIAAASGMTCIETLKVGDLVATRDNGLQPIRWIGETTVPAQGNFAPIVISKGAIHNDHDLIVSPQHGILIDDWRAELVYGQTEVLIRAVDLLNHDGVHRKTGGMVTYYHILLDAHHLVQTEGIWTESLYPGDMALQSVNPEARDEINRLFPDPSTYGATTAPRLRGHEATCLPDAAA